MKILNLTFTILLGLALLGSFHVNAMHHEDQSTSDATEKMPNNEGIVIETIDTTGYTYMELENNGKNFWIAAPTTQVKVGDHIRFVQSMTMENFSSKTLDRTFHRIVFVSSTEVKKIK